MDAIISYLLKSVACSALLYGYYRIALYNRADHQWNRFFLLGSVAVSLLLPLIKINIPVNVAMETPDVIRVLNVVATGETHDDRSAVAHAKIFDWMMLLILFYSVITFAFMWQLVSSVIRVMKIYQSNPRITFQEARLVMTDEEDTPFSFMNIIFWNRRIDLHSSTGKKIWEHEREHVRQLHSIDRLCMGVVTAVFWFNPFFWLIRKEMIVVHEFMADKKAIRDDPAHTFSEMILLSAFPGKKIALASTFFNSSIKRRLSMLTSFKNAGISRLRKWLIVPTLVIMTVAFTFQKKKVVSGNAENAFTLVIDAGHGGDRSGVVSADGTMEKDINLAIAKKIKEVNSDDRIRIILTRESDRDVALRDRVQNARNAGAHAFLSLHVNNGNATSSGIQIMMTKNENEHSSKSQLLGTLLSKELGQVYKVDGELRKGYDKGVWVLDAPEINYPALLIEFGNINHSADLGFIKSAANQEEIATRLLSAVTRFMTER